MDAAKPLFSWRKHWAAKFGTAPFLPMSRAEMDLLGWDACDIILVTGDAYVDHPSFGMAIIGRLLEAQGFRVGILSQPDWTDAESFRALGAPALFWGVTGGNMDSMVNRYTSDRRLRHDDSYTPGGEGGRRPDRAVIQYTQRCREAFKGVPVVLGGIEASLRRIAHYDYWSDTVRRSVLADSKADLLVYGNGERAIVEIAHRAARGEEPKAMTGIRGTARMVSAPPEDMVILPADHLEDEREEGEGAAVRPLPGHPVALRLAPFEAVSQDKALYAHTARVIHRESNPGNARAVFQPHGDRFVWLEPPPIPLTTEELDAVFDLPYARAPHPAYEDARIPAWEMIRFSVNIMRGCFGGCSFCSITEHEGRIIQSRSEGSILREIEAIRDRTAGFTGQISDLGGPTANMWRLGCKDAKTESLCRRWSCVYPDICKNLDTDHSALITLYRKARAIDGVKKISISSGLRYDLAVRSPAYIKELVTHHVGGYLKIAPEHTETGPLSKMMKPGMGTYDRFKQLFDQFSKQAGKKQYLIPYFIAAHPGTTDEDMMNLALWLKANGFRADQVQAFLPSPMALATAMYHGEQNPLVPVRRFGGEAVSSAKGLKQRRLHKAFLRYHDPENWPVLREALKRMGRSDLIGPGKQHLVPVRQPVGTGGSGGEGARTGRKKGAQTFMTTHARPSSAPAAKGSRSGNRVESRAGSRSAGASGRGSGRGRGGTAG